MHFIVIQPMGNFMKWCRGDNQPPVVQKPKVSKITEADLVKSNLKKARDYIQNFIDRKQKQRVQLSEVILKKYQKDKNKKDLLPFLQTKKQLTDFIQSAETRVKIIMKSIQDVEMQQTNLETMKVLEESNKFKQKIQDELEQMDWRGILEQAQEKYESPQFKQTEEEDEDFKALWKELGGDKMEENNTKVFAPVVVNVPKVVDVLEVEKEEEEGNGNRQVAYA